MAAVCLNDEQIAVISPSMETVLVEADFEVLGAPPHSIGMLEILGILEDLDREERDADHDAESPKSRDHVDCMSTCLKWRHAILEKMNRQRKVSHF